MLLKHTFKYTMVLSGQGTDLRPDLVKEPGNFPMKEAIEIIYYYLHQLSWTHWWIYHSKTYCLAKHQIYSSKDLKLCNNH